MAIKALKGFASYLADMGYIQELHVMERITNAARRSTNVPIHCTTLRTHFIHAGKPGDGDHLCLVLDVLLGDINRLRLPNNTRPLPLAKRILRDMLIGLTQTHHVRAVHTGLVGSTDCMPHPILTPLASISQIIEHHVPNAKCYHRRRDPCLSGS